MSYLLLHADRTSTMLVDSPVVPAAQAQALRDTLATLHAAEGIRQGSGAAAEAGLAAAHAQGHATGLVEGRAAGETEWRAELFRLAARESQRAQARRDEVAALALEVVRHVAGTIGPADTVAALASKAAATLAPDDAAVLRVPPQAVDAVTARVGHRDGLIVEPDAGLDPNDCVLETPLGRSHAGLETQLAQIERVWAEQSAETRR